MCYKTYIHVDTFLLQFELHLIRRKKVKPNSVAFCLTVYSHWNCVLLRFVWQCTATETVFCCVLFDSVQPLKLCSVAFCLTVYSHWNCVLLRFVWQCTATETVFCCVLFDSVQPLKLCSVVFCLTVYSHVIEISDFPMEFQTRDLIAAFKDYM